MERGIRLIGNGQAPVHKYWHELLRYIQEGKIHPTNMLTHRVLIDDMEAVYQTYDKRGDVRITILSNPVVLTMHRTCRKFLSQLQHHSRQHRVRQNLQDLTKRFCFGHGPC